MENNELIIPVYLNQRIVFDLIAMLQDGMSTVTRVNSTEESKSANVGRYGSSFGLSQALSSLLKIDIQGDRTKTTEGSTGIQKTEERVHTPSSLFHKLRSILKKENKIISVDSSYKPTPGDIVEFATSLRRNPVVQVMDTLVGLMDMAIAFEDQPQKKHGKQPQSTDLIKLKAQMEKVAENVKAGDTIDIVSDMLKCGYKAVSTLEIEFLNDPTMSDLVDGHFSVVGKIIRVIPDSSGSVNLLRKASIGAMGKAKLIEAFSHFSVLGTAGDMEVPEIKWEIEGPVLQILPVAIFA